MDTTRPKPSEPEKETEPIEQIVASVLERSLAVKQMMDTTRTLLVGQDAGTAREIVIVARRTLTEIEARLVELHDRHLEDVVINRVRQ